jgi:hypothetical protein
MIILAENAHSFDDQPFRINGPLADSPEGRKPMAAGMYESPWPLERHH